MRAILLLWFTITLSVACAQKPENLLAKGATTGLRVISEMHLTLANRGSVWVNDSIIYSYSNGRSSYYDPLLLSYEPKYTENIFLPFSGVSNRPTLLDKVNSSHVAYDSAMIFTNWYTKGSILPKLYSGVRAYDGAGNPIVSTLCKYDSPGHVIQAMRQVMIYHSGQLSRLYLVNDFPTQDTTHIDLIGYDSNGILVTDSAFQPSAANPHVFECISSELYTYNSSGQYIVHTSGSYNPNTGERLSGSRITNTYINNNQLYSSYHELYDGSVKKYNPYFRDTLDYIPGITNPISFKRTYLGNNGQANGNFQSNSFHYNALQQCDTSMHRAYSNGNLATDDISVLTYNAVGAPVNKLTYDKKTSILVLVDSTHYYYENYTVGVTPIPTAKAYNISTYPNPSTGRITINHPDLNMLVTISITNAAGQMVHAESLIPQGTKTDVLLGDEAPPGIYNIRITGRSNEQLYSGTLMKL